MITQQTHEYLHRALASLHAAEAELQRPKEAAVIISACHTARESISGMLRGYLVAKGIAVSPEVSLSGLFAKCAKTDPQFSRLDISCLACRDIEGEKMKEQYCLGQDEVSRCVHLASQVKQLVLDKLNIHES